MTSVYDPNRRHGYFCYGDICGTLTGKMGTGGGNIPIAVETLVFDEGQITCPTNGAKPEWNEACHSLSGNAWRAVIIIREKDSC